MNNTTTIDDVLKQAKGKEIDLTIVHHLESISLRTTGKLVDFNEDLIEMELQYRKRWFSRKKKAAYVVSRKTCSLLSIVIWNVAE